MDLKNENEQKEGKTHILVIYMVKLSKAYYSKVTKFIRMEPKSRPLLVLKKADSLEENFQNETLRPILKLQNDLIITLAQEFLKHRNVSWEKIRKKDPLQWLNLNIKRDIPFKNLMIGMVVGQFNGEELREYLSFQKEINKRIINMMTERIVNHYVTPTNKF
jgi:hypothetical protein